MIKVIDNFLPEKMFLDLQKMTETSEYNLITAGDKQFSIINTPDEVVEMFKIPNHKIILTFIRRAFAGFDEDLRIHCDGIIMNEKTELASVLYINNPEGVTENGTAFFNHIKHGPKLPESESEEEFNRLILDDSNDISKWNQTDYVPSKPNRLLTYNASMFHAKSPAVIEKGTRVVLVCFYSKF